MLENSLMGELLNEPLWLQAWLFWMIAVNSASLFFLRHREGQVILAVWIGNFITMSLLFEWVGYVRLLGLSHVIWWTPLVIYLMRRMSGLRGSSVFVGWVWVVLVTNSASLVVDYIDVVRYLMGDGAL